MINYKHRLSKKEFLTSFLISLKKKFLFSPIPKVAHTTIKKTLFTLEMSEAGLNYEGNIHDGLSSPFILPYQLPENLLDEILFQETFFKFAFVRNPIERAASGYLDKIYNSTGERKIERVFFEKALGANENSEITFIDFLTVLQKTPVENIDLHFKPQHNIMLHDVIHYNFIGSMNSIDEKLPEILSEIYNIPCSEIKVHSVKHHATHASSKLSQIFTEQKAYDLVQEIYENDFKLYESSISSI